MSDLFQERYRELPAFQRIMDILTDLATARHNIRIEEIATRLLMASENGLTWDTLCNNCAALMDKNYEQYVEIEQLKGKVRPLEEGNATGFNPKPERWPLA